MPLLNLLLQFVRRMGFTTDKPMVMFRPSGALTVARRPPTEPGRPTTSPVTVADRINLGWRVKYRLRFDDGTVSPPGPHKRDVPKCGRHMSNLLQ